MAVRRRSAPTLQTEPVDEKQRKSIMRDAKTRLVSAIKRVYTMGGKLGPVYAEAVRAVMFCEDKGMSRRDISQVIADAWAGGRKGRNVTKGTGARYFVLARRQRQGKPVIVEGVKYVDVLTALDSGRVMFTSVYLSVVGRRRSRGTRSLPANPYDAGAFWVQTHTLRTKKGAVKIGENLEAFAGVLRSLLDSKIAAEVLPPARRRQLWEMLMGIPTLTKVVKRDIKATMQAPAAEVPVAA